MAGASIRHNRIRGDPYLQFRLHSHRRASIADVKLQTPGACDDPDVLAAVYEGIVLPEGQADSG